MTTAAVEQYTGEGEPPYCEMTFRATDRDDSSPPDLNVDVQIEGARKPTDIQLKKKAVRCVCQVFMHRMEGVNCWKVAFVFFPKKYFQKAIEVNKGFLYTYPVLICISAAGTHTVRLSL